MSFKRRVQYKFDYIFSALKSVRLPFWFDSNTSRVALSLVVLFFGMAYIVKTSSASTTGYQMNKLETQLQNLESETKKLQIQVAEHSSMDNIQSRLASLKMIPVSNVKHIGSGAVVAKR